LTAGSGIETRGVAKRLHTTQSLKIITYVLQGLVLRDCRVLGLGSTDATTERREGAL